MEMKSEKPTASQLMMAKGQECAVQSAHAQKIIPYQDILNVKLKLLF